MDDLRSKENPEYQQIPTVKVITRTTEARDQGLARTSCVDLILPGQTKIKQKGEGQVSRGASRVG